MLTIRIKRGERILCEESGEDFVTLAWKKRKSDGEEVWDGEYEEGDLIELHCDVIPSFLQVQLDDVMNPSFIYLKEPSFVFSIPFEEKRIAYNPKAFTGTVHLLKAEVASQAEIAAYKNLCLNEYDQHENAACYPHAYANVETRGESVFAARNAIDGNRANRRHGSWPYESWGINQDPNAEITVDFGREVRADKIVLVTRADFPHDNWWKEATFTFSDGTEMTVQMEKSQQPHEFLIEPKTISWIKLGRLIKDETDPSPFPALSQIEVYGTEA